MRNQIIASIVVLVSLVVCNDSAFAGVSILTWYAKSNNCQIYTHDGKSANCHKISLSGNGKYIVYSADMGNAYLMFLGQVITTTNSTQLARLTAMSIRDEQNTSNVQATGTCIADWKEPLNTPSNATDIQSINCDARVIGNNGHVSLHFRGPALGHDLKFSQ